MKPELLKMCEDFIENRDAVNRAFKFESDAVYPICANIFLSHRKKADEDEIKNCRSFIKQNTSFLNNFRGSMYAPAACLLACSPDPEGKMAMAAENYKLLKEYFHGSEQMVLASLILTDLATPETAREKAERAKGIYKLMKEKHRFLTGKEDSVFALLLAFSEKSDEEMIDEIEKCFGILKGMADRDSLQTVSQILSMTDKPSEEKCARFKELFKSIRAAGMKYGKEYHLSVLASLSVIDVDIPTLVSDIAEVDAFLKIQKGYKGLLGTDKQKRLMHAAMIVSTFYSPSAEGNVAALASMLIIIAIQMMILMMIVMSSASTTAAAASH